VNARATLAAPLDGTLFFAGEATSNDGQGGTVNGALETGERAAREVVQRARYDGALDGERIVVPRPVVELLHHDRLGGGGLDRLDVRRDYVGHRRGTLSQNAPDGISTFSTPTVVHFCAALFVSAVLIAPWRSLAGPGIVLALTALAGLGYLVRIMLMTAKLREYHPDLEDWVFYTVLPFVSYGAILIGAIMLFRMPQAALFVLAGSVVLKLFIGIRNSWDVVTYLATGAGDEPPEST
jgi:hypothetical protein